MVKVLSAASILAVFIAGTATQEMPPEYVDQHSLSPDCLMDSTRKCDIVDIAGSSLGSNELIKKFSANLDNGQYTGEQFLADTGAIADSWGHTANVLTGSFPVDQNYQRFAAADIVFKSQQLPLITVFQKIQQNMSKVDNVDPETFDQGVQRMFQQSTNLGGVTQDYIPLDDNTTRADVERRQQYLSDEFSKVSQAFAARRRR